jgi:hypothetical protein
MGQGAEYLMESIEDDTWQADRDLLSLEVDGMKKRYNNAKSSKVGGKIKCAYCESTIIKKTYHHKFCNKRCKDRYWNTVDDERRSRAKYFK